MLPEIIHETESPHCEHVKACTERKQKNSPKTLNLPGESQQHKRGVLLEKENVTFHNSRRNQLHPRLIKNVEIRQNVKKEAEENTKGPDEWKEPELYGNWAIDSVAFSTESPATDLNICPSYQESVTRESYSVQDIEKSCVDVVSSSVPDRDRSQADRFTSDTRGSFEANDEQENREAFAADREMVSRCSESQEHFTQGSRIYFVGATATQRHSETVS